MQHWEDGSQKDEVEKNMLSIIRHLEYTVESNQTSGPLHMHVMCVRDSGYQGNCHHTPRQLTWWQMYFHMGSHNFHQGASKSQRHHQRSADLQRAENIREHGENTEEQDVKERRMGT